MTVVSALLVFGSVAAFATVYASASHEQSVLIVTRTIEQGEAITAGDLGQASVAISGGVDPIPVSSAAELSGRRAAVTIPTGSLLTMADTTSTRPILAGDAVVGIALKPGQLPAAGVEPGDQIMIVETGTLDTPLASPPPPTATADSTGSGVLVPQADVFDVQTASNGPSSASASSSAGDSQLVSVEVSDTLAPEVSTAAAAGQVSLVLLPASPASAGGNGGADGSSTGAKGGTGTNGDTANSSS
ncbi:MAG: SAF domain-containing protein [Acidimicrobiales bacterium]